MQSVAQSWRRYEQQHNPISIPRRQKRNWIFVQRPQTQKRRVLRDYHGDRQIWATSVERAQNLYGSSSWPLTMNKPFITRQPRNRHRPYCWVIYNVRGHVEKLSGWFASEEAATRWMERFVREYGPIRR